jgi:hypothetical protein
VNILLIAISVAIGFQASLARLVWKKKKKMSVVFLGFIFLTLFILLGCAIVTTKEAALFTDGRYFLQASQQLDNNWSLMKQGLPGVPTWQEYLVKVRFYFIFQDGNGTLYLYMAIERTSWFSYCC